MLGTLLLRFICHREIVLVLVLISADVALLRTSTPKPLRENDSRHLERLKWKLFLFSVGEIIINVFTWSCTAQSTRAHKRKGLSFYSHTLLLTCWGAVLFTDRCLKYFACEFVQHKLKVWMYSKPDLHFFEGINSFGFFCGIKLGFGIWH